MFHRTLTAAGVLAGALVVSTVASAAPGVATGNVNMRSGPGTQYGVITTIPAGAPIEVFGCQNWCQVAYAGAQGYVSGNYVSAGYAQPAPRAYYRAPPPVYVAPPPRVYYRADPWRYDRWDRRDRHWDRDHRRDRHWDRDWRWRHRSNAGSGIYFGFGL